MFSDVLVTLSLTPDSTLVAGGMGNTTLLCSVRGQAADVGTTIFTFTWQDRNENLIVSEERITVYPAAPSTTPFSTLTFSPLSTADTDFSCTVALMEAQNTSETFEPVTVSFTLNVISELSYPTGLIIPLFFFHSSWLKHEFCEC